MYWATYYDLQQKSFHESLQLNRIAWFPPIDLCPRYIKKTTVANKTNLTPGSTFSPAHSLRRAPHTANKFAKYENSPNFHFQWHQLNQIWKLNKIGNMDKPQIQKSWNSCLVGTTWCLRNGPKAHQKELALGQMTNKVVQLLKNHLFYLICTCPFLSWQLSFRFFQFMS